MIDFYHAWIILCRVLVINIACVNLDELIGEKELSISCFCFFDFFDFFYLCKFDLFYKVFVIRNGPKVALEEKIIW